MGRCSRTRFTRIVAFAREGHFVAGDLKVRFGARSAVADGGRRVLES
jgi:hypothetical protein